MKNTFFDLKIFSSNTTGAQLFLVISLIGTFIAFLNYGVELQSLFLIFLGYFLYGCLGVVITFHRYLTHKSFETNKFLIKVFSILGCLGGTGSPLAWVSIHINHHLKSDKENDPHSPKYKGLKIFTLDYIKEVDLDTKWRIRNLIIDKFQQILHRYYFLILIVYSAVLYVLGGFYLMIFLHWAPAALTALMSNVVNYAGHKPTFLGSYRSHTINDQSSNNWLWALPSWGEAWHNNHHRYPKKYYFGEKWWEIDVSGLIIKIIKIN